MKTHISATATDPKQYDNGEVIWSLEGAKGNPNRQLYLKYLEPYLKRAAGKDVLDIGAGQGWLCAELVARGARPVGIEPSEKNTAWAHKAFPDIPFELTSLQDYQTDQRFDLVFAVMVWEHFAELKSPFAKVKSLLKPGGQLVTIVGDYQKFTQEQGYPAEIEEIAPGETAIRTDYGARIGVLCDIARTVGRYREYAEQAGMRVVMHTPLQPTPDHPRYKTHQGKDIFHLFVLQ